MGLRLQIVSRQRESLGERGVKDFGQAGGTIGRSLESDWVLPDGQRFLSSRHASIDFRSGSYYIIDTSTNGVYINESEDPVGRGNPQRLFSGDRIRIGDYEIVAEIEEVESTRDPLSSTSHVDPVDARQRVDAPDPTGMDLVDPYEITGVGIEELLDEDEADTLAPLGYKFKTEELELELEPDTSGQAPKARQQKAPQPDARKAANGKRPPAEKRRSRARQSRPDETGSARAGSRTAAGSQSLDPFFQGAGLEPRRLAPDEAGQMLHLAGQLMRELLLGMTESLQLRAVQKARVRQSNTTIQPRENNALKFSASVEEAFDHLFFRQTDEYLGPVDSVRGAFADINAHQRAVIKAMRIAVLDYLGRLEPDELENRFSNGKRGTLMGAASKLKYWDLYRDLYAVLTQSAEGELPQAFTDEFARAYEEELARAADASKLANGSDVTRKAG